MEMYTKLVGSTFIVGANQFVSFLKKDDELVLTKEDNNQFDDKALAVKVITAKNAEFKIGYIPGASGHGDTPTNVLVRELMETKKNVRALVAEVTGGQAGKKNYGLNIKIVYEE